MLSQKHRVIKVRIGRPISVKDQQQHETLDAFSDFIRKKTYMLSNTFERPKILKNISTNIKIKKAPKKIVTPINPLLMRSSYDTTSLILKVNPLP